LSHEHPGKPVDKLSSTSTGSAQVVLPQLELAARFDRCVDRLVTLSDSQESPEIRESYVDLMVGLANAAAAMRATLAEGPDEAVSCLRSAIEHLQRVDTTGMIFPAGSAWRPEFP
jgi:hypothetical protein